MNILDTGHIQKAIADGSWKPNLYLNNISVAQFQRENDFVARKLFPIVPVALPMNKFRKFTLADLARINMQEKPAFGSVPPAQFSQTEDSYSVTVYQGIYGIDQISALPYARTGAPGVTDPKVAKARVAAEQTNLFMDYKFAGSFFKSGVWTEEWSGVSATPTGKQFFQFDNGNSDPIKFIDDQKTEMKRRGRRTPNKLALGAQTYNALKNNPTIIERIKYSGSSANPATVNTNVLAQLFGVEEVLVLESTMNVAEQGTPADMKYICDETGMLLCYTTNAPAIDEPSAGYIFTWDMLGNGHPLAITNFLGAHATHAEYVEALCSFDMKQVSTDLAVYFKDCVSA